MLFRTYEVHKLFARFGLVESTAEVASGGDGVLFFHTTHLHAQVFGLYNHHYTEGFKRVLYAVFYLLGHSFLHLQAMAKYVYHSCYLA